MRNWKTGANVILFGTALLLACPLIVAPVFVSAAHANQSVASSATTMHASAASAQGRGVTNAHSVANSTQSHTKTALRIRGRSGGLSCVPFARMESGIAVGGNAWQWWGNAAGTYARGATPEPGSVLAFRANGRMRLGHVAVVARVLNSREVLIDHANWPSGGGRGGVSQSIPVVDVSDNNDWSAVRVSLGSGDFGSVYPTYGFIYDRPDTGIVEARRGSASEQVAELNPAPRDLRNTSPARGYTEVAEAPRHRKHHSTAATR